MARYSGIVGYVNHAEIEPGVWMNVDSERTMKGDIIRQSSSVQNDNKVNSDIAFNHRVSLIGDAYAFDNYYNMKWITIDGMKWEIASVEIQRPRLIVTLGGMWNGD